jgi:hypothetical protein
MRSWTVRGRCRAPHAAQHIGSALRDLGDLDGAKAQLDRALAIGEAALGPDHPDVAIYRHNLAAVAAAAW